MKAQDQDHINDTERMLLVVSTMNEQSHYKQEKTRQDQRRQSSNVISSTLGKIKSNQHNLHQEQDDLINEQIVQDRNRSLSLHVNVSEECYPKSVKEARAFGKHLEEKHVTWVRFGKKQDEDTRVHFTVRGDDVRINCDAVRIHIFSDHVNSAIRHAIDHSASGMLHDKSAEESWKLRENLALYDRKHWNDPRDLAKPVKAISLP
ncbi:hypothetical protein Tco_1386748 [Tanacetum coccineum]